ncbi:MAG: hypothetical protein RR202_05025 [Bacteroidales bacterium]
MEKKDVLLKILQTTPNSSKLFQEWFFHISELLMNHFALEFNGETARMTELEFYYHDNPKLSENHPDSLHPDDTSHRNELQSRFATWYFHHVGPRKESGYKNLHYTGLDLCFGKEGVTFGILVRAIEQLRADLSPKERYVYGPSTLLLKVIFPALGLQPVVSGARKIENRPDYLKLMRIIEEGDLFRHDLIRLIPYEYPQTEPVYFAPRIGLNPAKSYHAHPYRFLIYLDKKHLEKGKIVEYIGRYRQPWRS